MPCGFTEQGDQFPPVPGAKSRACILDMHGSVRRARRKQGEVQKDILQLWCYEIDRNARTCCTPTGICVPPHRRPRIAALLAVPLGIAPRRRHRVRATPGRIPDQTAPRQATPNCSDVRVCRRVVQPRDWRIMHLHHDVKKARSPGENTPALVKELLL